MAAFQRLVELERIYDDEIPASVLNEGFMFEGAPVRFKSTSPGIWKPAAMEDTVALSIITTPNSPYSDEVRESEWKYDYQRGDRDGHNNRALRGAYERNVPIIYFEFTSKNPLTYRAEWPCWVVADNREAGYVLVQKSLTPDLGDPRTTDWVVPEEIERRYVTREVKVRAHQKKFSRAVLAAYANHCIICRLKEKPLLDAAHIIEDSKNSGEPRVTNGLCLCAIHHRAFDSGAMTVDPDYRVRVSRRLMEEVDGPMLEHGIKAFDGKDVLWIPRMKANRPDREALATRLEAFE